MDKLLQRTGKNISQIENELGIPEGSWSSKLHQGDKLIRVDIKINTHSKLRIPSGNEIGADELLWIPGGKTLGGFSEAIIEPIKVKNTKYIHNSNNYPMKREDEIIKSLNYTRCSKEYNIVKKSVFDGNLINIIVAKHYDSNAEVIDCSNIVWALHAMLVDNEVSLDRINKIINDVEVNRKKCL